MKLLKRLGGRTKAPAAPPTRGIVLGTLADLFEALLAEMERTGL